jgi:HSP20 family protein
MSVLARWEPLRGYWNWKDIDEIEKRLSTILRQPTRTDGDQEAMTVAEWAPLVDISEDEKEYLVKAELPEVKKEDVKLTVRNNVLYISGERKSEHQAQGKKYHRVERAYGRFVRSFILPEDADTTKVAAEYSDGILAVHVPKFEKAKPQSIDVKVA